MLNATLNKINNNNESLSFIGANDTSTDFLLSFSDHRISCYSLITSLRIIIFLPFFTICFFLSLFFLIYVSFINSYLNFDTFICRFFLHRLPFARTIVYLSHLCTRSLPFSFVSFALPRFPALLVSLWIFAPILFLSTLVSSSTPHILSSLYVIILLSSYPHTFFHPFAENVPFLFHLLDLLSSFSPYPLLIASSCNFSTFCLRRSSYLPASSISS